MSSVIATRVTDDARLEVDIASSTIAGVRKVVEVQHREALFTFMIVAAAPRVVPYGQFEEEVLHPHGIGLAPSDPMVYIRKLKLSADRNIAAATGMGGLLVSVRGLGYKLAGEWRIEFPRTPGVLEAKIDLLENLSMRCISIMNETPLISAGPDELLTLDTGNGVDRLLGVLVAEYNAEAPVILGLLKSRLNDRNLVSFAEGILSEIFTYFTFRRSGKVDERTWRHLFERELLSKVQILRRLSAST